MNNNDESRIMSSFSNGFDEIYALFLEFDNALNKTGGSSLVGNTSVCCLKWANVLPNYIEVVKSALQRYFILDFIDQSLITFIEHQMLTSFKEFNKGCHIHFKMYSDSEEARVNPPDKLVNRLED
ncbi:CACTA en-spm transposon protein [Cucumis melo var. makuwa]|uniref:CACTA en-spm transposon protein n=1 Tax=Cucumis melo var. makuwa TaxID=1194695 RepID=A0A5D3CQ12_CUCMM|nr:CACTA en-spm transposon protein [Cucumis melo var. makuwa]